ncbi:MAG: hypothetical protein QOE53_2415, partial [Pseudonocardiales bacterium]|nr:hypothetical protein [Pseudonocardiales bacterium]
DAFRSAWVAGPAGAAGRKAPVAGRATLPLAKELDRQLHQERIVRGTHRRRLHPMRWPELPEASFVAVDGRACLVLADSLRPWSPHGYLDPLRRPRTGAAEVITPPSTVAALRGGYRPQVDPAALAAG